MDYSNSLFLSAYGFVICKILSDFLMNSVIIYSFIRYLNDRPIFRRIIAVSLIFDLVGNMNQMIFNLSQIWAAIILLVAVILSCYFILRFSFIKSFAYEFFYVLISALSSVGMIILVNVFKVDMLRAFSFSEYAVFYGVFNLLVIFNCFWVGLLFGRISDRTGISRELSDISFNKSGVFIAANIIFAVIAMDYYLQLFVNIWIGDKQFGYEYSLFILAISLIFIVFCLASSFLFIRSEHARTEVEYQKDINRINEYALWDLNRQREHFRALLQSLDTAARAERPEGLAVEMEKLIALRGRFSIAGLQELKNIKNPAVLGLLTVKLEIAHASNLNVGLRIKGVLNEIKHAGGFELGEILGILMDNAIEAAEDSDEKLLEVSFDCEGGGLAVSVSNSFGQKPDLARMFEKGWSTKGEGRGLGLYIAKDIVSKNKRLLLNTAVKNGRLTQELVLS